MAMIGKLAPSSDWQARGRDYDEEAAQYQPASVVSF